jgi:peptidoglycan/LPS O-acetylase OafA/YrhL
MDRGTRLIDRGNEEGDHIRPAPFSKAGGYLPTLDGLRAVAILLVLGAHAGLERAVPGAFGVTMFFFLSGWLITRLLLAEYDKTAKIDFARFYLRRALRLLPAALAYIFCAGGVFVVLGGRISWGGFTAALFYGANYYDLIAGYHSSIMPVRHPYNILWSLAIEEQFYLLWPILIATFGRKPGFARAMIFAIIAVLLWRFYLFENCFDGHAHGICLRQSANPAWRYNRLYLATDTRADSLLFGALLALRGTSARNSTALGAGVLLLTLSFALPGDWARFVLRTTLQGGALYLLFPWLLCPGPHSKILSCRAAIAIGRLSYGLYLWHWGAFMLADRFLPPHSLGWSCSGLSLAAGFSWLSYKLLERPLIPWRRSMGSDVPV